LYKRHEISRRSILFITPAKKIIQCYIKIICFKGKAYGYVDEYHDDYRTMLFTYNADVILSDGTIENVDLDIEWK